MLKKSLAVVLTASILMTVLTACQSDEKPDCCKSDSGSSDCCSSEAEANSVPDCCGGE